MILWLTKAPCWSRDLYARAPRSRALGRPGQADIAEVHIASASHGLLEPILQSTDSVACGARQAARAAQHGAGETSAGETANVDLGTPSSQSDERGGSARAFRVQHFCYTSDGRGAPHVMLKPPERTS